MAKGSEQGSNPTVDWFFNDWAGGTSILSRHLKGCYMDLLHAQFNNGHISLEEIKTVLGSDFGNSWLTLQKKFATDEKGLYYNKRLEKEILKKKSYAKSRKENLNGSSHMGNGNGIGNDLEKRKLKFFEEALEYIDQFPEEMINKFCRYWTETKRMGKRMRFEMQKTFEIKRRLDTWKEKAEEYNSIKTPFISNNTGTGLPSYWDYNFAKSIMSDGKKLSLYYQSLRENGWKKKSETHWEKV